MANKLLKPKRGRVENLPKLAVEDGSLIFAYDTKSPTSTVLVDVGETRYELSAATAKKADDSNALGGSSLQNIVDKIDNATGDGTAFIGLDTTTNNKVKLTRANGTTVGKTVNNVSNASTADYAKVSNKIGTGTVGSSTKPVYINAGTPTAVTSIPSTFVTAQQINGVNLDTLRTPGRYFANGSNTNTGKPTGVDAFALDVFQSAGGWYTQICYASNNQEKQFVRYYNSGTSSWSDWIEQNRLNTKTQSGYAPAPNAANKVYRTDASGNPGWGTLNDSSIGKLASTVTLGDGNGAMIDQNGATYRQRINIFDNTIANDAVFSFQQSTDAGKTYKDLFAINDNGTVVASTFQGALKGTADYSKNSGALGGSSLQNIVDKINNSTGNGTAFTGLDTTTNNKVKLTRANGGTVEKIINNVSNASTADYAKNAHPIKNSRDYVRVANSYYVNQSSTITANDLAKMQYAQGMIYAATGNPLGKAGWVHIQNMAWQDGVDNWVSQLAFDVSGQDAYYRSSINSGAVAERSWNKFLDSANYTSYAAKKNAYNSASVSNATITLGRSDGSTGTTLTVNNVAHATNADLAKNSNALGGSSLKNITDRIDSSIAANDAMHYMGTLGATAQKPTITALPTTARIGDAYKVITAGTYSSIAAEVGDLFIYSGSWTLIPSGDDGNVYVGDSKSSKFAAKSNNIVVAVGDQKVASAANVTANAGTISALQSTMTQLKANQGTVTTLNGNKATFNTFNGRLKGDSDATYFVRSVDTRSVNTLPSTYISTYGMGSKEEFKSSAAIGLVGADEFSHVITHIPWDNYTGGRPFQVAYSGTKMFTRGSASDSAWSEWYKVITGGDALTSSASAISSTNNYFTAGATTALIAAKTASAVGNYLPLSGGTMNGTITAAIGNQKGIKIGNQWITSASDTNGEVVLQGGHLRFGTTAWDYNQWAGLKYNHSNKGIYLGIADGSQFTANSPQSGGSIYTPGIDNIYVGASTSQKVLTTFNYTSTTDGRYVKKSGDIMTGALNLQSAFKGITTQTLSGNTIKTGNNNVTITLPTSNNDTSNAVYMYANQNGPDIGIIYISPDTAFIANSGDAGYVFRVIDKDVNTNTNSNDGMLLGVRQGREGLDVRSSIFPTNNLTYSLGSSDLNWNNAYASTFHGYLNGVAKDSQALAGSTLAQIIEAAGGVITITKNLRPTVDWLDTGIAGTALSTGTYIVQVSGLSSGNTPGIYSEIWSGVFSWYSGGTNSTNSDEILLHNAGHADNSNELYLRTIRQGATSGGVMKLQMAVKQASTSTVDVTFKFRKMI